MYRQGLGDCFLLTFPRPDDRQFHILIDCGVILGTPDEQTLMKEVVDDIARTTSNHIDLVIATHEHWDHISGFDPDRGLFHGVTFGEVWLAWTEDPDDRVASHLREERAERLGVLARGLNGLEERLQRVAEQGVREDEASAEATAVVHRAREVLGFFGIDPREFTPSQAGVGFAAARNSIETRTARTMRWLRESASTSVRFLRPGEQVFLSEASGVRAYVLGPPTDLKLLRKDLPTRSGDETYGLDTTRLAAAEAAFFAGLDRNSNRIEFDSSLPFDPKYRIEEVDARNVEFFRDHYYGNGAPDDPAAHRRIGDEAVQGAAGLALKLDSDTNNTSLALAFELPNGQVLLFPGDAQVGNWESWHVEAPGKRRIWQVNGREVTAETLLRRTVYYKAGHHGSHNATLREHGLELMTHPNLIVAVSVDCYVARQIKGWSKMPFPPLVQRLGEMSRGRLILADRPIGGEESLPRLPAAVAGPPRPAFLATVGRVSDATRAFSNAFVTLDDDGQMRRDERRPLYVDVEIPCRKGP